MRAVCSVALTTLVGGVMSMSLMASPASATLPSEEPDNTGMVNGKVRAIVQAGGRTWVAGTFTQMMDANGNNVKAVNNLAAFDASSGAPDLSVNIPSVTKTSGTPIIYDMSVGPDGKVYIAGAFDKVNGVNRKNVAAFDPGNGALASFSATPANATSVLATADAVYVGTNKLLKLTPSGSDTPGYDPPEVAVNPNLRGHSISAQFRDIVQVGSALIAACQCDTLNDGGGFQSVKAAVKIDADTGNQINWEPAGLGSTSAAFGISAFVRDFPSASDRTVYLAAGGSDFTAAYDYESGAQRWKTDTSGSTQVVAWHQNTIIAGGHFQWVAKTNSQQCSDNANPNTSCWHAPRLVAMDPADGDVILQSGAPWNPGICCKYNGVWALWVDQDGGKLHVGGEFTKVGGAWSGSGTNWNLNGAQNQDYYARLFAPATGLQTLAVSKTGTGTVTSSPAGINCGATCSATYGTNTSVTLTASPGVGQVFVGWGGDCTGTSTTCNLTMSTSRNVVANFASVTYALTITKSGSGSGSVTSDVGGIVCGTTCSASYAGGTVVTLTAAPAVSNLFTGWSGGGCSGTGTCVVTMNAATNVTATFAPARLLTISKTGTGTGTVTSSSPTTTIDCGTTCSGQMVEGSTVTLTATASSGSIFTGWSGGGCSGTGSCVVLMDGGKTVTANFELLRTLSVSRDGAGSGMVTSNVGGIDCGTICSASYANGTSVTLTATAGSNSTFTGWNGGGCSGTGTCIVLMNSAQSVTATFGQITHAVTVTTDGSGGGTVSSDPVGISCPTACNQSFAQGSNVTLTATPDANSTFAGWTGGDCSGVLADCPLTVNSAKAATATFTAITHTLTVTDDGQGSGHVTSDPVGISCPSTCSEVYAQPQVVTLTADPDPGADFAGWSYGTCGSSLTCAVTMDADHTVTASYSVPLMLDVTLTGSGTGSVTSDIPGIICPAVDCFDTFPSDSTVTLTATPDADVSFTGWSGAGCSGTGTCVVTMDTAHSVTANFDQITHTLTVTPAGQGTGVVTSDVGAISCPPTCSDTYAQPTVVTLTAQADPGSDFAGWSGAECSGTGDCVVTMDQAHTVTATFTVPLSLDVTVVGDGSVTADAGSIDCPAVDCDDTFPSDSTVTLTADPDPNRAFAGWIGDCTGTELQCVVDMDAAKSATATFTTITHELTVDVTPGQGSGSVTSDVPGIDCPATTCAASYAQPTVVTLTAQADPGSDFAGWSGAGCSGTGMCVVTMDQARNVTATFTIPLALDVSVVGEGTVTSAPGSIDCPGTCSETFPSDSSVTLSAAPDPNRTFTGWSGAGCSGTGDCVVTMDTAHSVTATFAAITHTLTVTPAGQGTGIVTSDVGAIACPTTCSDIYDQPTVVTLSATADLGSDFAGWSGAGCSGTGTCVVTMDQARNATATFTVPLTLGVTLTGSGTGSVTSSVGAIACPTTCSDTYASDSTVTLTATPDADVSFTGWSGAGCSGTGTCVVTMDTAHSVTANFDQITHTLTVTPAGQGTGVVTSDVGAISCPPSCSDTYAQPQVVTLSAVADAGSSFAGWSGAGCSGTGDCVVTMDQARNVTATYDLTTACGRILFTSNRSGNPDVWVMDANGANETNLTNRSGSDTDPVWSPDCSKIAFTSTRSSNVDIYVMNANGTDTTRLTTHTSPDTEPTWSPDGSKIAFVSTRTGNAEIFVMNANGTNQVNETNHSATDTSPDWSPDGATIVFDSTRGGGLNIWTMTSTGASPTKRTTGLGSSQAPAWSPTGAQVAFVSNSSGKNQIWVMNANGSGATRLTNDAGVHTHPSWSPDGTKLAYASTLSGKNQIWVVNQNGSGATNTSTSSKADTLPSWLA